MSHITPFAIHAYKNRGQDIRVSVTTTETTTDFTSIEFVAGTISKTGLSASDTTAGFDVDFTLTATDLNITPALYDAELKATFAGQVRTLAKGTLHLDAEPTS